MQIYTLFIRRNILSLAMGGILLLGGCAQIVAPTGGPRDTTPPKITKTSPENNSSNFKEKTEIKISFDEFMEINNPGEKVMISPPLKNSASYKVTGKQLIIQFEDTLKENTTYTMFFDNCIKDITESNAIPAFEYVFSTGSSIDSGRVTGKVIDAFTLKPEKQVYVMLYTENIDSLPSTQKPYYLTKTNDAGEFKFSHVGIAKYKLFTLSDKNNNLIFDQFTERIGFMDSLIDANSSNDITISMFVQADTSQRLLKKVLLERGKVLIAFKKETNNPQFTLQDGNFEDRFFVEKSKGGDSIYLYDKRFLPDTVTLIVQDQNMIDTLEIAPSLERKATKRMGETSSSTKPIITLNHETDLYKSIQVLSSFPIKEIRKERIKLFHISKDTTLIDFSITNTDSIQRRFAIEFKKEEEKSYLLQIADSAFISYSLFANDTTLSRFTILSENDYGNLKINIENSNKKNALVQLFNDKEEVVGSEYSLVSKSIVWKNLSPGMYQVRAIIDENNNQKWDSGDYFTKRFPEKIVIFANPIQIRAKWDVEEKFIIN